MRSYGPSVASRARIAAVIASAVFWTWLWGPIGLLLSTPLTVCLVVLGRNLPIDLDRAAIRRGETGDQTQHADFCGRQRVIRGMLRKFKGHFWGNRPLPGMHRSNRFQQFLVQEIF